jgi:hypothetical protein
VHDRAQCQRAHVLVRAPEGHGTALEGVVLGLDEGHPRQAQRSHHHDAERRQLPALRMHHRGAAAQPDHLRYRQQEAQTVDRRAELDAPHGVAQARARANVVEDRDRLHPRVGWIEVVGGRGNSHRPAAIGERLRQRHRVVGHSSAAALLDDQHTAPLGLVAADFFPRLQKHSLPG